MAKKILTVAQMRSAVAAWGCTLKSGRMSEFGWYTIIHNGEAVRVGNGEIFTPVELAEHVSKHEFFSELLEFREAHAVYEHGLRFICSHRLK